MADQEYFHLSDLYCSAYLILRGCSAELVFENERHIVFQFPKTPETYDLVNEYAALNSSVGARDFARQITALRARMIAVKNGAQGGKP